MALVCRSWADAANHILYSSVALFGGEIAALFVRTLNERPQLGGLVKSLVINLRCEEESSVVDRNQAAESAPLVDALSACVDLRHLQVRPLHHSVRLSLLAAIITKPLASLLCGARSAGSADVALWSRGLFREENLALLEKDRLRTLDVNFKSSPFLPPDDLAAISFPALALVPLRVAGVSGVLLLLVLSAVGPTIETLDVCLEHNIHPDRTITSLLPSTPRLWSLLGLQPPPPPDAELSFAIYPKSKRPPTPVFDALLPQLHQLEELFVTATDISLRLFTLLPLNVQSVEVQSLNAGARVFCCPGLLDDLANTCTSRGLRKLVIRDRDDEWEERSLGLVVAACRVRGIEFVFVPDHEVYSEDGEDNL